MSTVIEKWDEILGIVKKEHDLSDVRFDTWLKPLKVYADFYSMPQVLSGVGPISNSSTPPFMISL